MILFICWVKVFKFIFYTKRSFIFIRLVSRNCRIVMFCGGFGSWEVFFVRFGVVIFFLTGFGL